MGEMNYFFGFTDRIKRQVKPEPKGRKVRILEMGVTGEMLMQEKGIKQSMKNGQVVFDVESKKSKP
jgi:hypothetical protein